MRGKGRRDEADEALTLALGRWPTSPSLLAERGAILAIQQDYDKALETFDEALAHDPGHVSALTYKIKTLRITEQFQEAGAVLSAALIQHSESSQLLFERDSFFDDVEMNVTALRLQERFQEAAHLLSNALSRLPPAEQGALLCDLGHYESAIKILDEALRLNEDDQRATRSKVLTLRMQRRFDYAGEVLTDAIGKWPESASLLVERGALLSNLGKYDEALDALDRSVKRDESETLAPLMKATVLRKQVDRGIHPLY